MHIEHGNAGIARLLAPCRVTQCQHLDAGAAVALHAMTGTGDDEQPVCVRRPVQRHIHGQLFAVATLVGMHVRLHLQTRVCGGCEKFGTGLHVAGGERRSYCRHAFVPAATGLSQALTSSIQ